MMKDAVRYEAMFDMLVSDYNPYDGISVENTQMKMHKYWKKFLEAGCDAQQIADMLTDGDLYENFELFAVRGVKVNMEKLALECTENWTVKVKMRKYSLAKPMDGGWNTDCRLSI